MSSDSATVPASKQSSTAFQQASSTFTPLIRQWQPGVIGYWRTFTGITQREFLRFIQQRTRFFSALIRPLLWLIVFAAGFRAVLGVSIMPPYGTYITYQVYIAPGLIAMIILFNAMQSALSMVYDREMGSMKVLLTSPQPRSFLLFSKLMATALVALPQIYAFLLIAWFVDVDPPWSGYLAVLPACLLASLMLGSIGLFISSFIRQLENFAGVMNFVIFPMFFLSSALYPLWKMQEAGPVLYAICTANPFTHAVELIRFSLYGELDVTSLALVFAITLAFLTLAVLSFDPQKGILRNKKR